MKKLLLILLTPIIFLASCSSGKDGLSPTTYSILGVWETTYANANGTDVLASYSNLYEFFWPDGTYGSEGYDLYGNLSLVSFGNYSLSNDQTTLIINGTYLDDDGDGLGVAIDATIPCDVITFNNTDLHLYITDYAGTPISYTKRLVKTNISLPSLQ